MQCRESPDPVWGGRAVGVQVMVARPSGATDPLTPPRTLCCRDARQTRPRGRDRRLIALLAEGLQGAVSQTASHLATQIEFRTHRPLFAPKGPNLAASVPSRSRASSLAPGYPMPAKDLEDLTPGAIRHQTRGRRRRRSPERPRTSKLRSFPLPPPRIPWPH